MSFTRALRSYRLRLAIGLAAIVAIAAADAPGVALANDSLGQSAQTASAGPQQQEAEDRDPEANLPYLFAVFFITWAAFFGMVFFMSSRQREMQREIDALKRALAEQEEAEARSGRE